MIEKLWFLIPEMIVFTGVVVVSIMGLSPLRSLRDRVPLATALALLAAIIVTPFLYQDQARLDAANLLLPRLGPYVNAVVCGVGILLVMGCTGLIDRRYESELEAGRISGGFDPMRVNRGEFFVFFLLSIMGVMLISTANDLIWLFLALELTSLPTYVMVAMSRPSRKAQEAGVKYFFLGALSTGMFLYGFALLYGATGTMFLTEMREVFAQQASEGGINLLGIAGMIISLIGIGFKIAAFPMHFYVADVYEGASSAVSAFLAFVPKMAGMLAIIVLLGTVGWSGHYADGSAGLPLPILTALWVIAVFTMTLGNVGAILQRSIKRMLAYSSIAHSGYMLIGVIAGPGWGVNGVMFYITVYGLMNTAAFVVLAGLERRGQELESLDEIEGLRLKHPAMAVAMALAAGSLLGVPPLLGFWGKFYLFVAGIEAGHIVLVIIAGVNTAISAWYYLALVGLPILSKPTPQSETVVTGPSPWPRFAALVSAVATLVLPVFIYGLFDQAKQATHGYIDDAALVSDVEATDEHERHSSASGNPVRPARSAVALESRLSRNDVR